MPTLIVHHNVKDVEHWLSSSMCEELMGPLGITNIRPGQVGRASTICMELDVSITQARSKPAPSNRLRD